MVHGCRIELFFANLSTTIPIRVNCTPYSNDKVTAFPLGTDDLMVDNPRASTSFCSVIGGGNDTKRLMNAIDMGTLSGQPNDTSTEQLTGFTGGTNSTRVYAAPADLYLWYVSAQSINGANLALNGAYFSAKVFYEVEFYSRLPLY